MSLTKLSDLFGEGFPAAAFAPQDNWSRLARSLLPVAGGYRGAGSNQFGEQNRNLFFQAWNFRKVLAPETGMAQYRLRHFYRIIRRPMCIKKGSDVCSVIYGQFFVPPFAFVKGDQIGQGFRQPLW